MRLMHCPVVLKPDLRVSRVCSARFRPLQPIRCKAEPSADAGKAKVKDKAPTVAAAAAAIKPAPGAVAASTPGKSENYVANSFGSGRISAEEEDEDVLELTTLRDLLIPRDSPFVKTNNMGGGFVGDRDRVRLHTVEYESGESAGSYCSEGVDVMDDSCILLPEWSIRSGPRKTVFYDAQTVCAAVVTCGGLCPGLNDVVQNVVYTLQDYGVPTENILGIRYGLRGFYERDAKPIVLSKELVDGIHLKGGTMLGTSRGGANVKMIVKRIDLWGLNMVFVVGGNGGNAAAHAIAMECKAQGVVCQVVGVPKSIDNDILIIDRCFGFETAVEEAQRSLMAAKVEAMSAYNGLGLVKLMGRQSGFIAMQASMASGVVDVCLIPEIPFSMTKLLTYIQDVFDKKGHCVVCVSEGAAQDILNEGSVDTDASGNPILQDVGLYLRSALKTHFKGDADIKYIDPSYMIRAMPTCPNDRVYCKVLGQGAVHAAFAGYTDCTVGMANTHYVYLPISTVIQAPRKVNPLGRSWNRLVTSNCQPSLAE